MISATNAFGWKLRDHGTPQQKARYLRPVASGHEIACLLFTEPQAGSDAANQQTRAVRRGDRWVINGTKIFITSGRSASVAVLLAVTDPALAGGGIGHGEGHGHRRRAGRGEEDLRPLDHPAVAAAPGARLLISDREGVR